MPEERDCGADAAAYALGALSAAEADAFRRHMAKCAVCQDEVAAFSEVADSLPMASPQVRPPRDLRRRVMRTVNAEARDMAPRRARWWRSRGPFGTGVPRPAIVGAAVAALIAVVLGGVELFSGTAGPTVIQARVIGAPGTAQLSVSSGHAELIVRHFPPPAAGHIYEVWLKRAGAAPSPTRALFSVTSTGAGDVGVPGRLSGVREVLVTQEPAGGSPAPTRAPVIIARLV
jgi:anti-sigma-K factor RskA